MFDLHSNSMIRTCQDLQLIGRHMNEKNIHYRHPYKFEYKKSYKYKTNCFSPRLLGPYTYALNYHSCCNHLFASSAHPKSKVLIQLINHSYIDHNSMEVFSIIHSR